MADLAYVSIICRVPADFGDFVQVDQRLDGLALEGVVLELLTVGQPVVGAEPVVQQRLRCRGGARVPVAAQFRTASLIAGTHGAVLVATSNNGIWLAAVLARRAIDILPQDTFTVIVFVVSFPRISITFTITRYSPGSSYSWLTFSANDLSLRVR